MVETLLSHPEARPVIDGISDSSAQTSEDPLNVVGTGPIFAAFETPEIKGAEVRLIAYPRASPTPDV